MSPNSLTILVIAVWPCSLKLFNFVRSSLFLNFRISFKNLIALESSNFGRKG
ncbi:hypothetical protein AHAS_Ahas20G0165600 [Arachis hypogaea]